MWMMYLAIPLGLLLMAVCYGYHTYERVTGKLELKEEEKKETE